VNIELRGYFDKNFGDDVMHTIIAENFPNHSFFVNNKEREMLQHLEKYPNVFINTVPDRIDVLLNVTGTGFMYRGKRAKAEKLLNILTVKEKKYPASAVINCSLEPFDSPVEEFFVRGDLKKYDLITCRDGVSYEYLKTMENVNMFPDLAFSLKHPQKKAVENILGVAPIRRMYDAGNYSYYTELAKFIDYYIEKNYSRVKLFAFDCGLENDVSAVLSIKGKMKHSDKAEIVIYNSDPQKFTEEMVECSLFAGSRFHSIVMAYALGIKAVGIYDRRKLETLCNDLDIPSVKKDTLTYKELINKAEKAEIRTDEAVLKQSYGHLKCLEKFLAELDKR